MTRLMRAEMEAKKEVDDAKKGASALARRRRAELQRKARSRALQGLGAPPSPRPPARARARGALSAARLGHSALARCAQHVSQPLDRAGADHRVVACVQSATRCSRLRTMRRSQ